MSDTYFEDKLAEATAKKAAIDAFIASHDNLPPAVLALLDNGSFSLTKQEAALGRAMVKRDEARANNQGKPRKPDVPKSQGKGGNPNS